MIIYRILYGKYSIFYDNYDSGIQMNTIFGTYSPVLLDLAHRCGNGMLLSSVHCNWPDS